LASSAVSTSTSQIEDSYRYCERVARKRAKNFYYSFLLLDRQRRLAMCAVYAFMRYCDDLSDDVGLANRKEAISQWSRDLEAALATGNSADPNPLWPGFLDTVRRYRIPHQYFFDMIEGVSSDLEPRRLANFDDLYAYCYRVASVVGLTIVHIFGFEDPRALVLAEKCGIAFQLTNILRDINEDLGLDRVYLPEDEISRFGLRPQGPWRQTPQFEDFMRFQVKRARQYYDESRPLIGLVSRETRSSMWALIEIYRRLLDRIEETGYRVLEQRVALSTMEKVGILMRALILRPQS
jgi:15-cis-phytoene synthase